MFWPAADPMVQLPTVAMPLEFVVAVAPVILPPPAVTANVTDTPAIDCPLAFLTITAGRVATAVPTRTVSPPPALTALDAGVLSGCPFVSDGPVVSLEPHAARRHARKKSWAEVECLVDMIRGPF